MLVIKILSRVFSHTYTCVALKKHFLDTNRLCFGEKTTIDSKNSTKIKGSVSLDYEILKTKALDWSFLCLTPSYNSCEMTRRTNMAKL